MFAGTWCAGWAEELPDSPLDELRGKVSCSRPLPEGVVGLGLYLGAADSARELGGRALDGEDQTRRFIRVFFAAEAQRPAACRELPLFRV